jgi:hypothetical protein
MPTGDPMINPIQTQQPTTAPQAPLPTVKPKGQSFWNVLGRVGTAAMNIFAPGSGSLVGALVGGGGGLDYSNMQVMLQQQAEQSMAMLAIQNRVQTQTQEFTTVSNLLKARHDGEMSAVNNFKS